MMMNNEKIILEQFFGAEILDIVLDVVNREYIEIRTTKGSFWMSCYDPATGETRDYIDYGVSP